MLKKIEITFVALLAVISTIIAQPMYSEGYFINNNNERIECEIINNQLTDSPLDFSYRYYGTSKFNKGTLEKVKEFGIYNISRFVRLTVNVDRSSTDKKTFSTNTNPEYLTETHFLNVVVDGDVKLYTYEEPANTWLFYSINDSVIVPLVYKQYMGTDPNKPGSGLNKMENSFYKEQLFKNINCKNNPISYFDEIEYDKYKLKNYFITDNACRSKDMPDIITNGNPMLASGYFIDNQNLKTECLIIKNQGSYNPYYFYYSIPGKCKLTKAVMDSIKEFKIYGGSRFVRATLQIDRSSENLEYLSRSKNPEYKTETLYLKVMLEGKAMLYYFEDAGAKRFFYSINNSQIQQLIKKDYIVYQIDNWHYISADSSSSNTNTRVDFIKERVITNNYYQQQLYNDLNCANLPINKITSIGYNQSELVNYFKKENGCNGSYITIK
jgi:hypothetical protein